MGLFPTNHWEKWKVAPNHMDGNLLDHRSLHFGIKGMMPFLWEECTPHTLISLQCIRHCSVVGRKGAVAAMVGWVWLFNATRTTPSH